MVERALKRFGDKFSLVQLMPSWEHRGLDSFNFGKVITLNDCLNNVFFMLAANMRVFHF